MPEKKRNNNSNGIKSWKILVQAEGPKISNRPAVGTWASHCHWAHELYLQKVCLHDWHLQYKWGMPIHKSKVSDNKQMDNVNIGG